MSTELSEHAWFSGHFRCSTRRTRLDMLRSPLSGAAQENNAATRSRRKDASATRFHLLRRIRSFVPFASVAAALVAGPLALRSSQTRRSSATSLATAGNGVGHQVCDPFARHGYVSFDPARPFDAAWIPFDQECPPAPDYMAALRVLRDRPSGSADLDPYSMDGLGDQWGRPLPHLGFLHNRLGLLLGDSVDRDVIAHFAQLLDAPYQQISYENASAPPPGYWQMLGTPKLVHLGWPNRPFAHLFANLHFGLANGFLYGLVRTSTRSIAPLPDPVLGRS